MSRGIPTPRPVVVLAVTIITKRVHLNSKVEQSLFIVIITLNMSRKGGQGKGVENYRGGYEKIFQMQFNLKIIN